MTPFRSEKNTNWEGAFRVPEMVRWPGKIPAGACLNEIVQHHDWLPTFLAAAGEPDVVDKLKAGHTIGDTTFKVHIDGYNLLPYLTGEADKSPRQGLFYFSDDGDVLALRFDNWKVVFMEQRVQGTLQIWAEPFVALRVPKLFNLRMDPFERADITSNTYYDWLFDNDYMILAADGLVAAVPGDVHGVPAAPEGGELHDRPGRREAARRRSPRDADTPVAAAAAWPGSPAATFRMGSDEHYPEEAPARHVAGRRRSGSMPHRSRTREFARVRGRDRLRDRRRAPARPGGLPGRPGRRTSCPGRSSSPARAGRSTCATSPSGGRGRRARRWQPPRRPRLVARRSRRCTRSCTSPTRTPSATRRGPARRCRPRPSGSSPRAAASTAPRTPGATSRSRRGERWPTTGTASSPGAPHAGLRHARRPSAPPRPTAYGLLRHGRQRLGVDGDWYSVGPPRGRGQALLRAPQPARRLRAEQPRPGPAAVPRPAKVVKGGSFLCADSYCRRYRPGGAPPADDRHRHEPHRLPLHPARALSGGAPVGSPPRGEARGGQRAQACDSQTMSSTEEWAR